MVSVLVKSCSGILSINNKVLYWKRKEKLELFLIIVHEVLVT